MTYNQRNCVLYRLGEKEIMVFWLETAMQMTKWLSMGVKEVATEMKQHKRY